MASEPAREGRSGTGPPAAFLSTEAQLADVRADLVSFLRGRVADAGAEGAVVAMSGGVDSTLTAVLAVEALGADRVLGLGLPCSKREDVHTADARTVAEGLGIDFREIQLKPLLDAFEDVVGPAVSADWDRRAHGNVKARLRMVCAYYAANVGSRLVVGTANRSELLLGYFTKYGDGGTDLLPLGDLYKTEVRALARHVGVPKRIVRKPPTAGFWTGQTDEADLGAPYDAVDRLLHRLVVREQSVAAAAEAVGVSQSVAEDIAARHADSAHKRATPPTPAAVGARGE